MKTNKDNVRICYKETCVDAKGKNGQLLVSVIALTVICVGVAALLNAGR